MSEIKSLEFAIARNNETVAAANAHNGRIDQAQARLASARKGLSEATELFTMAVELGDMAEADKYGQAIETARGQIEDWSLELQGLGARKSIELERRQIANATARIEAIRAEQARIAEDRRRDAAPLHQTPFAGLWAAVRKAA